MPNPQHKILFIDDDVSFLELASRASTRFAPNLQILTATCANDALDLLQREPVDLAAIDLHMPVVGGLELLTLLRRKFPKLIRVVLTGDISESARANSFSSGAELFLAKPNQADDWKNAFAAIDSLLAIEPDFGFRGVLQQIGLQDVLQLSCLTRRSMVLRVRSRQAEGTIYIRTGEIIHAVCGEWLGQEALNELLCLAAGDFELESFIEPPEETISQKWEFLLMEAARENDEAGEKRRSRTGNTDLLALLAAAAQPADLSNTAAFRRQRSTGATDPEQTQPETTEFLISAGDEANRATYDWQTTNRNERIEFLKALSTEARELAQMLPIGEFDRLEVNGPQDRIVAIVKPQLNLLVHTNRRSSHGHA